MNSNRTDKFGRKLTQVNVNWDTYWVPNYEIGDLVSLRPTKYRKSGEYGVIIERSKHGHYGIDFPSEPALVYYDDYEFLLVSPVDK